ncbi:MAG: hypothetical protein NC191_03210 [Muribaculaceae bacterium]|nr:hypothetical protein [Muribaculaceae bacterium]
MFDISSPTVYIPTIFLTLVAVFVSVLHKDAKRNVHENTKDLPYYTEIATSMGYIHRCLLEDGRFEYRKNINPELAYDNTVYNSLRHAGVLYSMYVYEKYGLVKKYYEDRVKSSKYFVDRYVKKLGKNKYMVLSMPEEEGIRVPIAKSGSAGVALCALSNLYADKEIKLEVLQGLGEFILSLQNEDGDIYAYLDLKTKEINKNAQAMFYPGEAAAGLLYLYEADSQQKWLDGAKKTLTYIAKTRKKLDFEIPFDHWSALAIEKLFKNDWVTAEEKTLFESYVEQMVVPMLSNQITNTNNSYCGAFKDNIMPCSLGTIMEGLASIYFCTSSDALKKIIFKSLSIGCMFLSKVQVKTGEQAGGLPNSANWVKPGVTPNASVIRIDNVQHVATAWLKFQQILALNPKEW